MGKMGHAVVKRDLIKDLHGPPRLAYRSIPVIGQRLNRFAPPDLVPGLTSGSEWNLLFRTRVVLAVET